VSNSIDQIMAHSKKNKAAQFEKLEQGFHLGNLGAVRLQSYNALYDPNMRHFFENSRNQTLLYSTGQIDRHGRIIDLDKNKAKLNILEREFMEAEKIEERRQKEEMEMRYRVQRKRFNELENAKRLEILERLKAERDLSKEIVNTLKMSATGGFDPQKSLKGSKSSKSLNKSGHNNNQQSREGFFVTENEENEYYQS
jgi:hypothetical protein